MPEYGESDYYALMMYTPAERAERMLRGETVDRVPFTVYENKVTLGRAERELRNDGMCIVQRAPTFYVTTNRTCSIETIWSDVDSRKQIRTVIKTPRGTLQIVDIHRGELHNPWREKYPFTVQDDYDALLAYADGLEYRENYEAVERKIREGGGDFLMRGEMGYSPMHEIMYRYMGIERFAFEWADNRSRVMDLYETLRERRRPMYRLAAKAPGLAFNICGNVTASVVGPRVFDTYYVPVYNEAADELHRGGKLIGVHFDGITLPYADAIRGLRLDYVEALTPPPTCDVTVAQAHDLWPEKAIWVNFPSSVHLESEERIRRTARQLLSESRPERRFLMGITEDVPPDRWPTSFRIILEEANRHRL